jgi:hypothetical protein
MRKSERIRLIEFQLIALEYEVEILRASIDAILQANSIKYPEIDSGKWYKSKFDNN